MSSKKKFLNFLLLTISLLSINTAMATDECGIFGQSTQWTYSDYHFPSFCYHDLFLETYYRNGKILGDISADQGGLFCPSFNVTCNVIVLTCVNNKFSDINTGSCFLNNIVVQDDKNMTVGSSSFITPDGSHSFALDTINLNRIE